MPQRYTCGISNSFELLFPASGQVAHVLRDRSPLGIATPFDLHFLGTSQAFVLSQDQTLHKCYCYRPEGLLANLLNCLRYYGRLGP